MSRHVLGQVEITEMHCKHHTATEGYNNVRGQVQEDEEGFGYLLGALCSEGMLHHVVLSKLDVHTGRPAAADRSGTHVLMGRHKITFENTLKKGKDNIMPHFQTLNSALWLWL